MNVFRLLLNFKELNLQFREKLLMLRSNFTRQFLLFQVCECLESVRFVAMVRSSFFHAESDN